MLFWRRKPVEFVSRTPRIPNIGDALASPSRYFEFTPAAGQRLTIIGGGAFTNFAVSLAEKYEAPRVLWSVGRSIPFGEEREPIDLMAVHRLFQVATTRDPESAGNGVGLLPCVSCLHPICDLPPGDETGVILNADPKVSDGVQAGITNALPEPEFMAAFARLGRIVTNSYHAAYWGLLSGREVAVIGYSSKFQSLLTLCGIDGAPAPYRKGDGNALTKAIEAARRGDGFVRAASAGLTLPLFRRRNIEFANELAEAGIFLSVNRSDCRPHP